MRDSKKCLIDLSYDDTLRLGVNEDGWSEPDAKFRWILTNGRWKSLTTQKCISTNDIYQYARLIDCKHDDYQTFVAMKAPVPNAGSFEPKHLCKNKTRSRRAPLDNNALPEVYRSNFQDLMKLITNNGLNRQNLASVFALIYQTDLSYYLVQIRKLLAEMGYVPGDRGVAERAMQSIDSDISGRAAALESLSGTEFITSFRGQFGGNSNPYESYGFIMDNDEMETDDEGNSYPVSIYISGFLTWGSSTHGWLRTILSNIDGITRDTGLADSEVEQFRILVDLGQQYGEVRELIDYEFRHTITQQNNFAEVVGQVRDDILSGSLPRVRAPERETLEDDPEC